MHQYLTSHDNRKAVTATITSKGQVTIPAAVRKRLKLQTGDTVAFEIQDEQVSLKPVAFTLESAFGSVPTGVPQDFEELIREAKAERAKRQS
ncbi:AbrB/MazE/SpoVT family DNA-binding domain-containing protein [Nitrolancea hollandica]|uniref:AbrB/MazE/SpoVT family DNA-binding domain-containing protein n=1 Tax=Nitrolancea hollandica TaxID=1206749 RepID=UPI000688BF3E|nr:AbrB/MazE/SpoVT family DNA-binding domain-containing protein [Nitrolancea hollandica]